MRNTELNIIPHRKSHNCKMNYWQLGILFLFPVLSCYGYTYVGFNLTLIKALYFISVPIMIVYVIGLWTVKQKNNSYFYCMSFILLSTVLSILMAYLFSEQSLGLGYRATAPYLAIIFYFYLLKTRPVLKQIEIFVWIFAGIYIVLWLYGISKAPEIVFGDVDGYISDSRGVFRLRLPGRACVVLAFFLALNKYVVTHKTFFLTLSIFLFTIIVLQVTRQIILFSFLVGICYLLLSDRKAWVYLIIIGCVFILFLSLNKRIIPEDSVIGQMLSLTGSQVDDQKSGEDDVRIQEYRFFFNDFSKNLITDIFGNGVPHHDSKYGRYYVDTVQDVYRFFLSDVGYAQMFAVTGWVGLLLYLFLFLRVARQKVPSVVMFAKLFVIYQIFANIAASWYTHDVICICVCIYVLSVYNGKKIR